MSNWNTPNIVKISFIFIIFRLLIILFLPESYLQNFYDKEIIHGKIFIALIIAPLIETLMFQSVGYIIISKFIKTLKKTSVVLSGFIFAFFHIKEFNLINLQSTISICLYIFMGVTLQSIYLLEKINKGHAFLKTTLLHLIYNLTLIISILLGLWVK